jgi:sarcosine oxidase
MPETFDAIVLGLGAMGAAATWQLAKRGAKVLGIDQYAPPHELGSSHGESRITRLACAEGAEYHPFARRSHDIWREIERELKVELLTQNGMVMISAPGEHMPSHGQTNFLEATVNVAKQCGVPHEMLSAAEVRTRFPALKAQEGYTAYFDRLSGFVRPERCIEAQLNLAGSRGAHLLTNERVSGFRQDGSRVTVTTDKGVYRGRQLIVAAGAYLPTLLDTPELRDRFTVTRQVFYWFKARNEDEHRRLLPDRCPVYIWQIAGTTVFYGFPALGGYDEGLKVATEHEATTTAAEVDRSVSPREIQAMYETFIAPSLPGLSSTCVRTKVCLYTQVEKARFLIDRHPALDRVIVASPCSGHGFKHSAAIGELLAGMALGLCDSPEVFRFGYAPPVAQST